jgi:hypothetical protein
VTVTSGLVDVGLGVLSHALTTGAGGYAGYLFARRQTEYEVGYGRRVEAVEGLHRMIFSAEEAFEEALERVGGSGYRERRAADEVGRTVEELERRLQEEALWLEPKIFGALEDLVADLRGRSRDLAALSGLRGPELERERAELEDWLRAELPLTREGLAEAFREMLGVGRWRRVPAAGVRQGTRSMR